MSTAPFRLSAIVSRLDRRDLENGSAGEGRFVFSAIGENGALLDFNLILESPLPAEDEAALRGWAMDWAGLSSLAFGDDYNLALQNITDRFTTNIPTVRTNEIVLLNLPIGGGDDLTVEHWPQRQFSLDLGENGPALDPAVIADTPDISLNQTPLLAQFINENGAPVQSDCQSGQSRLLRCSSRPWESSAERSRRHT